LRRVRRLKRSVRKRRRSAATAVWHCPAFPSPLTRPSPEIACDRSPIRTVYVRNMADDGIDGAERPSLSAEDGGRRTGETMPFFAPSVTSETDAAFSFLAHQSAQLRVTALGLSAEQARRAPTACPLSVPGLDGMFDGTAVPDRPLEDVVAVFDKAVAEIEVAHRIVEDRGISLRTEVSVPSNPWMPADFVMTVGWILWHLATEVARHAGHAD